MPTQYHLSLKGFVGDADFDRRNVDEVLDRNSSCRVNVLIDSLGGYLATGISISESFRLHGDVAVHFVGLNASAATVASLGAAHISIDAGAMYMVHKCSLEFFEWGMLNADQLASIIADCEKMKSDLDKMDLNVAKLYARKCNKPVNEILELMKKGGWLSADEALDWGFVDEITDYTEDEQPEMTDSLASVLASAGIPIPVIPIARKQKDSFFNRLADDFMSWFKSNLNRSNMAKESIELEKLHSEISGLKAEIEAKEKINDENRKKIADLEDRLSKQPADVSKSVVENSKQSEVAEAKNAAAMFAETYNSAKALYDEV